MNFIQNIKDNIYSPSFYNKVLQEKFSKSLRYFLILILILTVIKLITLINPILAIPTRIQQGLKDTLNCYPQELAIKVSNGQVTTNVQEPYYFKPCSFISTESDWVIDTKTPYTPQKFEEYKTPFWLTKDSIVYKKSTQEIRIYTLSEVKDFKVDKTLVNSIFDKISPYVKFIGPALLVFAGLGIYLMNLLRLIHLLILSAIILFLGKIFKKKLTYQQSYKVGLHALTLGLIVQLVVGLTTNWTHFSGFPFMITGIALGIVIINVFKPKKV